MHASPARTAGQLMMRRKKGQEGSAVAQCGVGLLLLGNEQREAQGEEEQEDERERSWAPRGEEEGEGQEGQEECIRP